MSNNATRDASYITKKNSAKALNSDYTSKLADVNSGVNTFMVVQSRNQTSAEIVTARKLGCFFCAKETALRDKADGKPYNANLLDMPNSSTCSCGGRR